MPRVNAERKAKKLLNSLVSGHVESFQKAEIFGHSRSLAEFDELRIGDIEGNLQTLQGETEVSSLLAISYMSKWSHQMMSDSLQVALMLGIGRGSSQAANATVVTAKPATRNKARAISSFIALTL